PTVTFADTVAPVVEEFTVEANSDGTATVTVNVDDPNATVTVTDPNGDDVVLTQNPDGSYSATIPAPAAEGAYTASVTDGTNSTDQTVTFADTVAPVVEEFTVEANSDGTATVTVNVDDPNATVTVTDPNGDDVVLTQNPDGSYSATVPAPAAEGDYEVTATDGTNSSSDTATLTDNVAPEILDFIVDANSDGTATVTVTVNDPNANVTVTGPDNTPIQLTNNG